MQEDTKTVGRPEQRPSDFPSELLAKIIRSRGKISVDNISKEGDVKIRLPLKEIGVSRKRLASTPFTKTDFFVDLLGEILVRKNINMFAEILNDIDPRLYDKTVNGYKHRHFGINTDKNNIVTMDFHISLVQRILTEELSDLFRI